MGGSHSTAKNTIDAFVSSTVNVLNQTVLSVSVQQTQSQSMKIVDIKGDVNISGLNWSQVVSVDTTAFQTAVVSNDVQNKVEALVSQAINQITQTFSFRVADKSEIENLTKMITQLSTNITNSFKTDCLVNIIQTQSFSIERVDGSVTVNNVDWSQASGVVLKCIQNSDTVNKSVNDLIAEITQKGTMKQAGMFDWLADLAKSLGWLALPIVILGAIFIMKFMDKGIDVATSPKKILGLVMLAAIVVVYFQYKKKGKDSEKKEE